jgi:tight adherence protein B
MSPILLSIFAFVAVAAMIGAVANILGLFDRTKAEDRLEILAGPKSAAEELKGVMKDDRLGSGATGIKTALGKNVDGLSLLFEQADSPISLEIFSAISAGLALVAGVAVYVSRMPVPVIPLAAAAAATLPFLWLLWRRAGRFKKFGRQLPDALELIGRALRSGHSLASGLHVVVEEMPEPISTEFRNAYEEQNLGVPIEYALKGMLKRMPNMDLKFFVTAVAIQRQTGGDLAEILDKIGEVIRERFKILGMIQALTGEGRLSGSVLMAMPIAIFFAVLYLNPNYVMVLFTTELGKKMIATGIIMQILGAVCIKKIIDIKV